MTIVSGKEIVQTARQQGYAVGAFNTNNLEWTQAILRVAQAKQAPTIIAASMGIVPLPQNGSHTILFGLICARSIIPAASVSFIGARFEFLLYPLLWSPAPLVSRYIFTLSLRILNCI